MVFVLLAKNAWRPKYLAPLAFSFLKPSVSCSRVKPYLASPGVAMLPLYEKMDERGKMMNSAFCVMGAYVLGGQMAFMAGVTDGRNVGIYILSKLVGGVLAAALAAGMCRTMCDAGET